MKYEIYIIEHATKEKDIIYLRDETNDINLACDLAHNLERNSSEQFDATAIYDTKNKKWFGYHERGCAYVLSK